MLIGPFCFFNFQKTTYLQLFTMVMRNSAMVLMIMLTVFDIANGHRVPVNQLILWDTEKAKEVCLSFRIFWNTIPENLKQLIKGKHLLNTP